MPMASDTEKRDQDVRGAGGHVQDKGMERRAAIWVWSQGLKGMSRQRDYMSMPGGLSLDMAPWETLPGFPQLHLQPSWSLPLPPPPAPHPSPWTRAPWHLKQCFVHCDTSSPPQCLVQCLTLRRHKINAQQMKRWMRRKRRYIQELVTTEAKVSNGGKSRKQENKDRCNLA